MWIMKGGVAGAMCGGFVVLVVEVVCEVELRGIRDDIYRISQAARLWTFDGSCDLPNWDVGPSITQGYMIGRVYTTTLRR